jgi:hypothetical protein
MARPGIRPSLIIKTLILIILPIALITGCSTAHKPTQSQRSAVEQLLMSEAIMRSLPADSTPSLPIPKGASVVLDASVINVSTVPSPDKFLLEKILAGWFGQQGYAIQKNEDKASYRINIVTTTLGTELGDSFFGMPPVNSVLIPFSLPELALYKNQYQTGYVKFYMDIFELPAGKLVHSSPFYVAETYYNDYTVLLFFSFSSTNLPLTPELDSFHKPMEKRIREMEKSPRNSSWELENY